MLTQIAKPTHGSQEWLNARWKNENGEARIAASACAAVHGQHPFVTIADLATELLAENPPQPKAPNSAMLRGTTLEAPIRDWAAQLLGHPLREPEILFCYDEPGVRLIATIDSMSEDGRVFEQKTTNKVWRGKLPDYWYWQGVQQAICTGVSEITWVIFDSTLDLHFHVQGVSSDEKQNHIEACRQFLASIDMGMMPDGAVMEYRHVAERFPEGKEGVDGAVELPQDALALLERYQLAKEQKAQAEQMEDLVKAQLCEMLGTSEYGMMQDELILTWKTAARSSFDTKKFEADHPALASKYKKQTTYRTFRVVGKDK
jgi:predicted phage-related endonuclease